MNTPVHASPALGLGAAQRCVVLGLEGHALILGQAEVLALESVLDMQPVAHAARYITGAVAVAGRHCAVYSLDADLNRVPVLPARHRICAVLNHPRGPFALSCCEVRMVERAALELHPLPRAFAACSGPLRELAVLDGRLLLGTTAAALLAHVAQPQQAAVIEFDAHARKVRP